MLKQVLLLCFEKEKSLATLDYLVYSLSQAKFSDEITEFLDEKTRLVFSEEIESVMRDYVNGLSSWL